MSMTNFWLTKQELDALAEMAPENGGRISEASARLLIKAASRAHAWREAFHKPVTVVTTKEPA